MRYVLEIDYLSTGSLEIETDIIVTDKPKHYINKYLDTKAPYFIMGTIFKAARLNYITSEDGANET